MKREPVPNFAIPSLIALFLTAVFVGFCHYTYLDFEKKRAVTPWNLTCIRIIREVILICGVAIAIALLLYFYKAQSP